MTAKETSEQTVLDAPGVAASAKGSRLCSLTSILFPIIDLLLELLSFFLIDEGEAGEAVLQLESMEKGPVLVVAP